MYHKRAGAALVGRYWQAGSLSDWHSCAVSAVRKLKCEDSIRTFRAGKQNGWWTELGRAWKVRAKVLLTPSEP